MPDMKEKREQIFEAAENLKLETMELEIMDEAQYHRVGDYYARAQEVKKAMEDLRKAEVLPHRKILEDINLTYKEPAHNILITVAILNKAMIEWTTKETEKRRLDIAKALDKARVKQEKLIAKADKLAEKGKSLESQAVIEKAVNLEQPVKEVKVEQFKGQHVRKNWLFKITDESLIPREYLIVDSVQIGQICRESQGTRRIPGVLFYAEEKIISKGALK